MRSNPSRFKKSICIAILLCGFFAFTLPKPALATPVSETASIPQTIGRAITKLWDKYKDVLKSAGSKAFQSTVRSALNKVAYDTASYVGSGGKGQQPLFVTKNWGSYLTEIGDEAAGQFIEDFADSFASDVQADQTRARGEKSCTTQFDSCNSKCASMSDDDASVKCSTECTNKYVTCSNNVSTNYANALANNAKSSANGTKTSNLNLCNPSVNVRMKIALGLVNQQRPTRPNCSWSDLKNNWASAAKNVTEADYYAKLRNMFEPQSSDLSAALTIQTGMMEEKSVKVDTGKTTLIGKGGWVDPMNIGGKLVGLPDQAKTKTELAQQGYISNMGKFTGDALIDAGNVFLNQLSMTAFNTWIGGLNGGESSGSGSFSSSGSDSSIYSYESGSSGSASYYKNKLSLMSILKPQFAEKADYNVLADMAVCPDAKNPGPNNCVIDNRFMEAISSQKTIGEALSDGSLNGSWSMTTNSKANSFQESYSLRNAMILRKFRVLPVGWEAAIEKAAANGKNATLMDIVSCFSATDSFHTFSSPAIENNQTWCRDLIDPKWVLKAPQSYCAKSGFGNQIISSQVSDTGTTTPSSELAITRQDDYCADEKTCIKENSKGVCDAYGYCTEDRRTWNFGSDSCDPTYNSCETFADSNGNTISYLKNTLDYGTCSEDNSGCRQYSTFGSYASSTDQISWSGNNAYSIFLNSKAESCDATSEGCHSITRIKPSWGDNLIFNNDFALDAAGTSATNGLLNGHWQVKGSSIVQTDSGSNTKMLGFAGANSGLVSDSTFSVVPGNITPVDGYYYTLSAEIYSTSGNVTLKLGGTDNASTTMSELNAWQTVSVTAKPSDGISSLDFSILTDSGTFYLRNIKLEANNHFSGWSNYNASVTQEKLIPSYLAPLCYVNPFATGMNDYRLKDNAPAVCSNFARRCNKDEVGCQNFTSTDGFSLTGKVSFDEYCPQECVNYDSYVQQKTNFQSVSANYFIPSSATTCSASAAGCSRFTNLDDVAQGGETNEYYSALRRCVQPDNNTCGAFYSWSGENESGYQLTAYSLVKNGNQPSVGKNADGTAYDDSAECNKTIFELTPASPDYNPDCRQFYDKNGVASYHLYSKTITCSTDCRRVRLDETTNEDECKNNGGTFASSTCIFQALPSQSTTCSAEESGCREYNGNNGNNVRIISSYDFEDGNTVFSGAASISTASTNKNGKSIQLNGSAATQIGSLVTQNAAYSLKFLAKAGEENSDLRVYFVNANGNEINFNSGTSNQTVAIGDTDWRVYQISLPALNHRVESGEKLVLDSGGKKIFIDSIVLTEITDRYYLIKDSWVTPDICYYDLNDDYRGAEYNLGCSAYTDPNGTNHNLRQFSSLCDSSSAGCEAMVDTQNSTNPFAQSFASSTVNIAADKMIYAIFDSTKTCAATEIGCSRLGKGEKAGSTTTFSDAYIKNNPDDYNNTICQSANVGCETFYDASGGASYFRNPFGNACQYRASQSTTNQTWGWFKLPAKRCDANSDNVISGAELGTAICGSESNCNGKPCIIDSSDYPCDVSYFKTIGNTSAGTAQPSSDAGICEAASSGCSEYIDASSEVSPNLVVNPTFADLDNNGTAGDLWTNSSQNIYLSARKLYVARSNGDVANLLTCDNYGGPVINILGADNKISTTATSSVNLTNNGAYFTLKYDSTCHVTNKLLNNVRAKSVEVREALVAYQVEGNMDTKTCGSKVDFDDGCVLFNNRAYNGTKGSVSPLTYNAFTSPNVAGTADTCTSGSANCNANVVVKVTPNRVCSRWLSCTTKIKDEKTGEEYCYSLGECDKLAENGDCANFVSTATSTHTFTYANDKNATGYQLLNSFYVANMQEVGNRSGDMMSPINFEGSSGNFNFEGIATNKIFTYNPVNASDYTIIQEPKSTANAKFSVSYPAEGKKFIGFDAKKMFGRDKVNINSGTDYYINYLVNTDELTPGAVSMVRILDSSTGNNTRPVLAEFTDKTNGWQRVVHKINVPKGSISVMFGVKQTDGVAGTVYYDDIKMEPVLKVNNTGTDSKDYIAKECRLYPSEDNLTCTSNNENVVKNGLEGYCLKHDPINPGVCLQWLPIDNIASASVSEKNAGYKGVYPLYYCAEANANFDLVEARVPYLAGAPSISDDAYCDWGNNSQNGIHNSPYAGFSCPDNYKVFYYEYSLSEYNNNSGEYCAGEAICVPDEKDIQVKAIAEDNAAPDFAVRNNDGIITIIGGGRSATGNYVESGVNEKKIPLKEYPGWYPVNGNSFVGGSSGYQYLRYEINSAGWYKYDGSLLGNVSYSYAGSTRDQITEKKYYPYVRVYDNNNKPTSEDGLRYLNNDNNSNNPTEKTFYPTCNKFVEVVDSQGNGMPWVERLSKNKDASTTPAFFPNIGTTFGVYYNLADKLFGLLKSDSYGAAILNGADLLSTAAVQFITNNTGDPDSNTPYAGRPYGCQDGGNGSCKYIGYCENNPATTCLTVNGDGSAGMCGSEKCISYGYGSENSFYVNNNQKNTLKNIFLKSIDSFTFGNKKYTSSGDVSYDATNSLGDYNIKKCASSRPADNTDFGTTDVDFCAVWPKISNVYLYRGNGTGPVLTPINLAEGKWNIGPGYYTLKFNSFVDAEQQPMKEIRISWGDGNIDIISNQDNHPSTPHVISHNYGYSTGVTASPKQIKIQIKDNWDYYANFPVGTTF